MKVYLITDGDYSDYRVVAVTLDRNKAEKIKEHIRSDNDIEEYDTDNFDVYASDGHFYKIELNEYGIPVTVREETAYPYYAYSGVTSDWKNNNHYVVYDVYAKDRDTAIKIARDMRIKSLASRMNL